jgi:hypothetical protein
MRLISMSACSLPSVRTGLLALGALLLTSACSKEEETPKLFDEDGVWSLQRYDLSGTDATLTEINVSSRGDSFLLKFDSDLEVVSAAWCGLSESDTPNSSLCRLQPDEADWYCRCFAYAYEESRMRWVEFDAGRPRPMVELDGAQPAPTGETEEGDGGGEETGSGTVINLAEVPTVSSTYDFIPLPQGLFGSNGETSAYRFQRKSPTLFDQVTCTPCAE